MWRVFDVEHRLPRLDHGAIRSALGVLHALLVDGEADAGQDRRMGQQLRRVLEPDAEIQTVRRGDQGGHVVARRALGQGISGGALGRGVGVRVVRVDPATPLLRGQVQSREHNPSHVWGIGVEIELARPAGKGVARRIVGPGTEEVRIWPPVL